MVHQGKNITDLSDLLSYSGFCFILKYLIGNKRGRREGTRTFCMTRASRVSGPSQASKSSQITITISGYLTKNKRQQRGPEPTSLGTSNISVLLARKRPCCYLRTTQLSEGMCLLSCPKPHCSQGGSVMIAQSLVDLLIPRT